tara:strand:+ start:257 stop:847 length:591 start_codon:yes stop_codon:yes gene_type:complete
MEFYSVSDSNIERILEQPALIWRLIARDELEVYEEAVRGQNKIGFFAKLLGKKAVAPADISDLEFAEGEGIGGEIDKAWNGIHYCLNKTVDEAEPPMDFITIGGKEAGNIDVGYGPARLFSSKQVKEINACLSEISEDDFRNNYDPSDMEKLEIYPNIWERDGEEALDYISEYYNDLKSFISNCAKNNLGLAICLC